MASVAKGDNDHIKEEQSSPPTKGRCLNKPLFEEAKQIKQEHCPRLQVDYPWGTVEHTPIAQKPIESPASDQASVGSSSTSFKKRLRSPNIRFFNLSPSPAKPQPRPTTPRSGQNRVPAQQQMRSVTPRRSRPAEPSPVANGSTADTAHKPPDGPVVADTGGTPEARVRRPRVLPADAEKDAAKEAKRKLYAAWQQQKTIFA